MSNRSKQKGTKGETTTLELCLRRVWPRMERTGSKVAFGQLPDYDDPEQRSAWAWEHKFSSQQRLTKWWEQAKKSAAKVGLLAGLIWKQDGRPAREPWVIFTWTEFEPVAQFVTDHLEEFEFFLDARRREDDLAA